MYEKFVGSKNYQAPEILLGDDKYDEKIDVFSLGLVFAHIILGRPLFSANTNAEMLYEMFSLLGSPTQNTWPRAWDLAYEIEFKFPKL